MTTALHDARLRAVLDAVAASGAATVLDMGCGDGDLALRLARAPGVSRITALDTDLAALRRLVARLDGLPQAARARVTPVHASMTRVHPRLRGYDCACLVETIEHLPPGEIPRLERALFHHTRPRHVVLTTPNADFNPLLGVPAHRRRHPGHQFEWGRVQFARWTRGVAGRHGYDVALHDVAGAHPRLGGASQMALFTRADRADRVHEPG